jgi:hypothetical protein
VQLLDIGLIQVDLGHRRRNLGVGEHAHLLPLGQQALYLIELLHFYY